MTIRFLQKKYSRYNTTKIEDNKNFPSKSISLNYVRHANLWGPLLKIQTSQPHKIQSNDVSSPFKHNFWQKLYLLNALWLKKKLLKNHIVWMISCTHSARLAHGLAYDTGLFKLLMTAANSVRTVVLAGVPLLKYFHQVYRIFGKVSTVKSRVLICLV